MQVAGSLEPSPQERCFKYLVWVLACGFLRY